MNFLQLCQRVQLLTRGSEGLVGTTPTTTVSQEGNLLEIVEWVNIAYADIQAKHRQWRFLTATGTVNTSSSTRTYTITSTISTYAKLIPYMAQEGDRPFILCHLNSIGVSDQSLVYYTPWAEFVGGVLDRGSRPSSRPSRFTIQPSGVFELDPTPDNTYVLTFDYRRSIDVLSGNTDEPLMSSEYHMAIVWRAVHYYCITRDGTSDFYQKVQREYDREMRRLENAELPDAELFEAIEHP